MHRIGDLHNANHEGLANIGCQHPFGGDPDTFPHEGTPDMVESRGRSRLNGFDILDKTNGEDRAGPR